MNHNLGGSRAAIFWLQILYLAILAVPAWSFVVIPGSVPKMLGPLPTGVPWFGALGAVMISLWGVTEHRGDWDPRWKYWHWSRPFVGASLAVVTVLILQAGILAVGSTPSGAQSQNSNLLYFVIAFVVGYREETFRDLIKKVADVILTPGSPSTRLTASALIPANGPLSGGTKVTISGTGFTDVTTVRFGTAPASFTIKSDMCIEAVSPQVKESGEVAVTLGARGGETAAAFVYES